MKGTGSTTQLLTEAAARELLTAAWADLPLDGKRVRTDREDEGLLCVRNAGEILYRAADLFGETPPAGTRARTGAY
jgi:hypothetical protein